VQARHGSVVRIEATSIKLGSGLGHLTLVETQGNGVTSAQFTPMVIYQRGRQHAS